MNFTVIDFETANSKRASACALGIVKVVDGKIAEQNAWLVRPDDMKFNGMNIAIHGIRPEDVENEPEFDALYHKIFKEYLEGQLVVAHNASFDMSVLRKSLDLYNIEYPEFDFIGNMRNDLNRASQETTFPFLSNHLLVNLSGCQRIDLTQRRGGEARVVAQIQIRLGSVIGNIDLAMLIRTHGARINVYIRIDFDHSDFKTVVLENTTDRGSGHTLSEARTNASGNKDILAAHE